MDTSREFSCEILKSFLLAFLSNLSFPPYCSSLFEQSAPLDQSLQLDYSFRMESTRLASFLFLGDANLIVCYHNFTFVFTMLESFRIGCGYMAHADFMRYLLGKYIVLCVILLSIYWDFM